MKYLPLVWAALARKPVRSFLIFLSAAAGFALFGVTIGINTSLRHLSEMARLDRLYISSRYDGAMTLAQEQEIAGLKGVARASHFDAVGGYVQRPGNPVAVLMVDGGMRQVFPELPLSAAQWQQLELVQDGVFLSRAQAVRFGVKQGDSFPVLTQRPSRADGGKLWRFEVLGVVDDIGFFPAGFSLGNYVYLDQSRPYPERGHVTQIWLLASSAGRAEALARAIEQRFANSSTPLRAESEKSLMDSLGGPNSVIVLATEAIAGTGLAMIIFLTANAMAQSVRERLHEFAVLKTIGFRDGGIIALVFVEAALPCLAGAALGLTAAAVIAHMLPRLLPSAAQFPVPSISPPVVILAFAAALLVAFVATALPALRLARQDVASALARK